MSNESRSAQLAGLANAVENILTHAVNNGRQDIALQLEVLPGDAIQCILPSGASDNRYHATNRDGTLDISAAAGEDISWTIAAWLYGRIQSAGEALPC